MSKDLLPPLFKLLDEHCTAEQISDLLRRHKDTNEITKKAIRYSGTKDEILRNLRQAVDARHIPKDDVYELLRDSEEHGRQHIFYFRAANPAAKELIRNGGEVAERLWGEDWDPTGFPVFDRKPNELIWSDFRQPFNGKANDWVAKLYGDETHDVFQKEEREAETLDLTKYYRRETIRTVSLVRWNSPDLLEIRVDSTQASVSVVRTRLADAWKMLGPAFAPTDFKPRDIQKARRAILSNRGSHRKLYRAGTIKLIDSNLGGAEFYPYTDEESADGTKERKNAIDAILDEEASVCSHASIYWLPDESDGILKDEVRTILGGRNSHEMIITARTSREAVDYVTNQLRHFSK